MKVEKIKFKIKNKKGLKSNVYSLSSKVGFTLIELMIVVAIIGILAAIAIPRVSSLIETSKQGATKGNLSAIRSAMALYYSDNEGRWPTDFNNFSTYLLEIPRAEASPLGKSSDVTIVVAVPVASGTGWAYNKDTGELWCNSTATDTKGTSFTTY